MFESLSLPGPAQLAVAFVLALFPLVLIHEFGHFLLAKINKIGVDEFGIGFPPRVFRIATIGETEYTVNALPLGGFVRLAGEDDPEVPNSFAGRSKSARTAVLLAGPAANFAFAALIMSIVAAGGPIAQELPHVDGVSIVSVVEGGPAAEAGLQEMDLIVAADGVTLADATPDRRPQAGETKSTVALQELTDAATDRPMSITVLRGLNKLPLASLPEGTTTRPASIPGVTGLEVVEADSATGIGPGDLLLTEPETSDDTATGVTDGSRSWLSWIRGDDDEPEFLAVSAPEVVEVTVTPYYDEERGRGLMGIAITQPIILSQLSAPAAAWHGVQTTALWTRSMVSALVQMLRREMEADLRGPLGIADLSRQAAENGATTFFQFMAILSINLAIINLLPIPALDGGRLLFITAEAVRGRRVEPSREAVIHLIGFALVLGLMAMLTLFDVKALLTGS